VPTIACARHPHNAFDFCRTAKTVEQYAHYLRTAADMPVDRAEMRRQSLAFYYMHNLHGDADELALRRAFVQFWKECHNDDASDEQLVASFDGLRKLPAFGTFAAHLIDAIRRTDANAVPSAMSTPGAIGGAAKLHFPPNT